MICLNAALCFSRQSASLQTSADSEGLIAGLLKAGGSAATDVATLQRCLQAAALRHKELSAVLSSVPAGCRPTLTAQIGALR